MQNQYKRLIKLGELDKLSAIGRYAVLNAHGYKSAELLLTQRQLFIDNLLSEKDIAEVINSAAKNFILTVHSLAK